MAALVLGADAAIDKLPVMAVQVTELADGVFIGITLNHSVGDGTAFWHFFNTWSEIHRRAAAGDDIDDLSTPPPSLGRWFPKTCLVPIPMPFRKLEHIVKPFERTTVQECFFTFSAASVKNLKAQANAKIAGTAAAGAAISSLQAVLAHLWRAVCRARRLPPEQATFYSVVVGCRGRVSGIPSGYVGNAMVFGRAVATTGEVEEKGLGWTAWLLNRAVASFDEAGMRESLKRWVKEPDFTYMGNLSSAGTALVTGSSPRFDVFGNDFGWGKPVAVRSGAGNKADGKATVFEGPERGGSMSLEACIAPDALAMLGADEEFMAEVAVPNFLGTTSNDQTFTKCYTYASVPLEKLIVGPTPTGLGVSIRLPQGEFEDHRGVHVKAHVNDPTDCLHASTLANQLAAEICSRLNLRKVTFPGSAYKTAQKLAKRARQSLPGQGCRFTCDIESHANSCLVLQALRNVQLEGFSFISVHACKNKYNKVV